MYYLTWFLKSSIPRLLKKKKEATRTFRNALRSRNLEDRNFVKENVLKISRTKCNSITFIQIAFFLLVYLFVWSILSFFILLHGLERALQSTRKNSTTVDVKVSINSSFGCSCFVFLEWSFSCELLFCLFRRFLFFKVDWIRPMFACKSLYVWNRQSIFCRKLSC